MKKDILTIFMVAIVGLGTWLYLGSNEESASQVEAEVAMPEMLDNDYTQTISPAIQNPPSVEEAPAPAVTAVPAAAETPAKLSDLEKEIVEVLANAHAVHDNYERADATIEAKLDLQVRAALERRAITPREAPEYRDYLRQIAIEEQAREEEEYEPEGPAISGIFADRSFVTEE